MQMEVVWDFEGVSPQLSYLLDNNQLVNPTAPANSSSKEDKLKTQCMPDLGAAYLGPQIWSKTMVNEDLKLEPVDWDELLDENTISELTIDQQVADLALLMCPSVSEDYVQERGATSGVSSGVEPRDSGNLVALTSDHGQPASHVKPSSGPVRDASTLPDPPRPVNDMESSEAFNCAKETSMVSAMSMSPVCDYQPSVCDALLSTSASEGGAPKEMFDPRKRTFTDDELKPQPIIRKAKKVYVPEDCKDSRYWRKREKNNIAAKRSREARRVKENQIAMRANFLEKENENLRTEVAELRDELARLMDIVKGYQEKR